MSDKIRCEICERRGPTRKALRKSCYDRPEVKSQVVIGGYCRFTTKDFHGNPL